MQVILHINKYPHSANGLSDACGRALEIYIVWKLKLYFWIFLHIYVSKILFFFFIIDSVLHKTAAREGL